MMHRKGSSSFGAFALVLAASSALAATGCHGAHGAGGRALTQAAVTGLEVAAVAAAAAASHSPPSEDPAVGPAPDPAQDPTPPQPRDPPFDIVATRAALRDVDLSACKTTSPILAHAKITLSPTGDVVMVAFDDPDSIDAPLRACVARHFADAAAPAFGEDADVTIGFGFTLR